VKLLQRIRRAITGSDRSTEEVAGRPVGTEIGFGEVEAAERQEFPPEEFTAGEQQESE